MGSRALLVSLTLLAAALAVILLRFGGDRQEAAPDLAPGQERPADSSDPAPLRGLETGRVAVEEPGPAASEEDPPEAAEPETEAEPAAPPPGCLRVVVRRGGAPVAGRTVHLLRSRSYWLPRDLSAVEAELVHLILDAEGEAIACSLEPGTYIVGVELDPGQIPQRRVKLVAEEGATVRFDLAGASLTGHVYDDDGVPVEGARVQVDSSAAIVVWTDAQGAYRVEAIAEGVHWVGVNRDGSSFSEGEHMLQVAFAEGEAKRLDFGDPAGLATWSGFLRNRAGDPVGSPEGLRRPARLHLLRLEDRDYRTIPVGEDGRFTVRLARGRYQVKVNPPGQRDRLSIHEDLPIDSADLEQDIVLPGTRVSGRVRDPLTGEPGRGRHRHTVQAHLEGQTHSAAFHRTLIAPDGRYAIDGLGPGVWRIGPSGTSLEDYLEVRVREEDVELSVDLEHP